MLVEICIVALYCDHKSVISNLVVNSVMFHVSSVIIIEAPTDFLNMIMLTKLRCTLIAGSNSVSMLILNLRTTVVNESICVRFFL